MADFMLPRIFAIKLLYQAGAAGPWIWQIGPDRCFTVLIGSDQIFFFPIF
jgi:hypothetical protein